jgi:CheY-like chemotaxis protein
MPRTLLLADDSVTIQKVVGITFANEDVELVTVDNGDVALARAREIKPDLVLADVAMPGMSGYELCQALKQDSELSHIPVVLLTGTFETFDAQRASDVGSDGHITKPFEAQALIDCVNSLLSDGPDRASAGTSATGLGAAPPLADDLAEAAQQRPPEDLRAEDAPPPWDASPIQLEEVALEPQERAFGQPLEFVDSEEPRTEETPASPEVADPSPPEPTAPEPPPSLEALGEKLEEAMPSFGATATMEEEELGKTAYLDPEPMTGGAATADPNRSAESTSPLPGSGEASAEDPDNADLPAPTIPPRERAQAAVSESDEADATDSSLPGADALFDPSLRAQDLHGESAPLLDPVPEDLEPTVAASETGVDMLPPTGPESIAEARECDEKDVEPLPPSGDASGSKSISKKIDGDALRQALEKAAWEAFGSISEQLVQETVRKVEEIAWELVPQIAERLILDEIERLKDEKPPE